MSPRRQPRERGAVSVLAAFSMITLIAFTALAVDIGLGASRTRDLQQVADLVALDVARVLDGSPEDDLALRAVVSAQAIESAARNDFAVVGAYPTFTSGARSLTLDLGCWTNPTDSTTNGTFTTSCAAPDAVLVEAQDDVDYRFADVIGISGGTFDRDAVAARVPTAITGIGSVALGLQDNLGPLGAQAAAHVEALNGRLNAAFGTDVSLIPPPNGVGLDLVSYQGLAAADVALGDLAAAAGFGTPAELADATLTNGQLFEATAVALESEGNNVAASYVRAFAAQSDFDANGTMRLGDGPLQFEQGTGTADDPGAARATINVMDLLVGAAAVADNRNFVSYTFNPGIPGVASVSVDNRIVEPMRWRAGPVGTTVSTAQVRAQVTVFIDGSILGIPGLSAPIQLPIVVEGATGVATLNALRCYEPDSLSESDVGAVTSLTRLRVGVAQNLQAEGSPALTVAPAVLIEAVSLVTLLDLGVAGALSVGSSITGTSDFSLGGGSSTHTFFPNGDPNPPQRSMGGVAATAGTGLQAAMTTNLPLAGTSALLTQLSTVFGDLGGGIIDPVLHAAGVTLGGADVVSEGLNCDQPKLVA